MSDLFSQAELGAFADLVRRVEEDPQYRLMVALDLPAALRNAGLELPDRAAVRQSLVELGITAEDLAKFDRASLQDVAAGMAVTPVYSADIAQAKVSGTFYRGVQGFVPAAHWWGFHVPFAYADIDDIFKLAQAINSLVGTLGGFIAKAAPPIKPFVLALLLYILAQSALISGVSAGCRRDRNAKGTWVSMAWIAPGVFVPTCVH